MSRVGHERAHGAPPAASAGSVRAVRSGRATAVRPGRTTAVRPGRANAVRPGRTTAVRPGRTTAVRPGRTTADRPGRTTADRPGRRGRLLVAGPLAVVPVLLVLGAVLPPSAGAVVAGTRVRPADHPAVVRLADACTATLVAPRRLLTAAHCIPLVTPGRTRVRIGGERLRVVRVARHPRFQYLAPTYPAEPYRDLALAELEAAAPVAPLRVSWRRVRPGGAVALLGYGTGDPDEPRNFGVLRTATLVVRDDRTCRRALRRAAVGQAEQYRRRVMLCTQDPDGVRPFASGCFGDSGAPLLRGALDDAPEIVAVDSWGVACGDRDGDPEVFARVSAERAFVEAADPGWSPVAIEQPFAPGPF